MNLLHGRGVLYSESGYIIYHGEFVNGLRAGYGVEYYVSGKIMYSGRWNGDRWNGQGGWWSSGGEENYRGEFVNGEPKDGRNIFFFLGLIELGRFEVERGGEGRGRGPEGGVYG